MNKYQPKYILSAWLKMLAQAQSSEKNVLNQEDVVQTLYQGLENQFTGKKVIVIIPDHTRSIPLPSFFRWLIEVLHDVERLDFLVALGTHPKLSESQLCRLVGIDQDERNSLYQHVGIINHHWDSPNSLLEIGVLSRNRIKEIAGSDWHPTLWKDVPVTINKIIFEYDHVLILAPTAPHEVAGFSGGTKYLFPGISGKDMIDAVHWLGALAGVRRTIGIKSTPVREMIHAAAEEVHVPITLIGLVVVTEGLAGVFIGDINEAWSAAVDLSTQRHIRWYKKPFERILSQPQPRYDELWTGAKAFYKVDPVVADGGEVIIYAPQLSVVSKTHGDFIYRIGYHVRDYFLKQWDRFEQIPPSVLAHSTHVKGDGDFVGGVEIPRVNVLLASQINRDDCQRLGLGYLDPREINPGEWKNREGEGILFVPEAGETLYRLQSG